MELVDRVGLLCMIINGGRDHKVVGRTMLQKMTYFCRYLGWDVGHYQLHYYGPFSFELTDTIRTAESVGLIKQGDDVPHTFELTDKGRGIVDQFTENVCDSKKVKDTNDLIVRLSDWKTKEIELATTIDFVYANISDIGKSRLIDKVHQIKSNFKINEIEKAYDKWMQLKKDIEQYD